ncbi:hypothetical protein DPMN_064296 [Dreissena polymorpha]|uniref:Uncharacterized protein n=1 Tax=Dreissena polymorpha TaxID=45954 RepID=A0A9D4CC07_DREPO|nr:hypothetical protein DPMN_064296 [Dreissena polymorpha]
MAILIRTSAVPVPSLDRVVPMYFFSVLAVHGDVCTGVTLAVHHDFRLRRTYLNPVCSCSSIEYVCEILKCIAGATQEVNVVSESQLRDGSSIDGDGAVVVMESLLQYLLNERIDWDESEQTSLTPAVR